MERRVAALEGHDVNELAHLSDVELRARFVACCERLEAAGELGPDLWREAVRVGDYNLVIANLRGRLCEA